MLECSMVFARVTTCLTVGRLDEVLRHRSKLVAARTPASSIRPVKPAQISRKQAPYFATAPSTIASNLQPPPAPASVQPSTFAAPQQQQGAGTSASPPPPPPATSPAAVNGRMKGIGAAHNAHDGKDRVRSKKQHGRGRERDGSPEPERHSSHRHGRSHDSSHRYGCLLSAEHAAWLFCRAPDFCWQSYLVLQGRIHGHALVQVRAWGFRAAFMVAQEF